MTTLYAEIDKKSIIELPQVHFDGRIVVIQTLREVEKAVSFLLTQPLLGIDTETRPAFRKGTSYKVALLQISTKDICFLFRMNFFGLPNNLVKLLTDKKCMKVGLSLKDDLLALHKRCDFANGNFLDLQDYVKNFGICDMSLQKLYANIFHQRISKSQRLSNWEADVLSEAQKQYAATDAWACLRIYERLEELRLSQDFRFISQVSMDTLQNAVIKDLTNKE